MGNKGAPKDWLAVKLGDIASITTGKKDVNEGATDGKYPFFTCSQKEYKINDYSFDTEAILVAGNAYFNIKYYKGKFDAYQRTYVIDGFKDNAGQYLYYVLSKDLAGLTTNNQGSAVKYIKLGDLTNFEMLLPPFKERQKIINILLTVDSVIDQTQAVIDQTQTLKKGLMQDLFTRGISGRHKKFKKTELGEVPEDWSIVPLETLSSNGISNGIFKKKHDYGNGALLVNVLDTYKALSVDPSSLDRVQATKEEIKHYGLARYDLLFVRSSLKYAGIGQCCMICDVPEPMLYECHLMRIRPDQNKIFPLFLAYYCASTMFKKSLFTNAKIQTMTTLSQKDLGPLMIPLPTKKEQDEIAEALYRVDEKIAQNDIFENSASRLKNALMQVLLTGEVRVKC